MPRDLTAIRKRIERWVKDNTGKHYCECGCGETVEITEKHYIYDKKIPRFIVGHNLQIDEVKNKPRNTENFWDKLSKEEQERRLSNLKPFGKGEKNINWGGGEFVGANGYRHILHPDHPFAVCGYVLEHRLVVEEWLRENKPESLHLMDIDGVSYLNPGTVIHHIDENKLNNSEDNLMIFNNQAEHVFWHQSKLPEEEKLKIIQEGTYYLYRPENP